MNTGSGKINKEESNTWTQTVTTSLGTALEIQYREIAFVSVLHKYDQTVSLR